MQSSSFVIVAAQSSSVKGDLIENTRRHADMVRAASKHDAKVIVFPELSLTGYEPTVAETLATTADDDFLRPLQQLSNQLHVTIVAGCPIRSPEFKPYLGAFILRAERPVEIYRKRFLHGDEERHFIPFDDVVTCESHDELIGIAICADISNEQHPADVAARRATAYAAGVAMTPNGIGEAEQRMSRYAQEYRFVTVMANYASTTGGHEMGGRSGIWDESGRCVAQAESDGECLIIGKRGPTGWSGEVASV